MKRPWFDFLNWLSFALSVYRPKTSLYTLILGSGLRHLIMDQNKTLLHFQLISELAATEIRVENHCRLSQPPKLQSVGNCTFKNVRFIFERFPMIPCFPCFNMTY